MAKVNSNSLDILTGGGSHGVMKRGFYEYASPDDSSGSYIHFKTNVRGGYIMSMIEAKGCHFGAQTSVHAKWVFYSYSTGSLYRTNFHIIGEQDGIDSGGVYLSSDNYVCIWGRMKGTAVALNITFNAIHPCPTGSRFGIQITSNKTATTSGVQF